jgi:hypothetical protein
LWALLLKILQLCGRLITGFLDGVYLRFGAAVPLEIMETAGALVLGKKHGFACKTETPRRFPAVKPPCWAARICTSTAMS